MSETVIPKHVGIILDGNRRWAKAHGMSTLDGHREGAEVFKEIALNTFDLGVEYLSAFVFSTENWSRTKEEVGYLMKLVVKAVEKYLDTFHEANIKVVVLGKRDGLPDAVIKAIDRTEKKTKNNTKGTLALCFNYGGEEELADAVKKAITSGMKPEEVTSESLQSLLYGGSAVPPVDLLIRTSGEQRTSGFMLYRAAYAEIYFSDKLWPDFSIEELKAILDWYAKRDRRFGT